MGSLSPRSEDDVTKADVGVRPNGLAYDPDRCLLLSANIGDPTTQHFVNLADPFQIVVIDPESPAPIPRVIDVPARGSHGLELDSSEHRLLCACDEGKLVSLDSHSGEVLGTLDLTGRPMSVPESCAAAPCV